MGWICHQFTHEADAAARLVARAREFSCMVVLVGHIASADVFDPKYAAILQNGAELTVPLELSTLPTAGEFRDAIASLSPEQQGFARAFRSMQLESTLFGILIIQIKPQLERALRLPEDCLTKEIKLTQQLMQLFTQYQLPTDLLACDAAAASAGASASTSERLRAVRGHVSEMNELIAQMKAQELEESTQQAQYDVASAARHTEIQVPMSTSMDQCLDRGERLDELVMSKNLSGSFLMKRKKGGGMLNALSATLKAPARLAEVPMSRSLRASPAICKAPAPREDAAALPPCAEEAAVPAPQRGEDPPGGQPTAPAQSAGGLYCGDDTAGSPGWDYSRVPAELDSCFEELGGDAYSGALRPTIINVGCSWTKQARPSLLAEPTTTVLDSEAQKAERNVVFDLLDALTKSGALPLHDASLHIVIAATHSFEKSVVDTVIEDNVNPIEKVERSALAMAATVHRQPAAALVQPCHLPRLATSCPELLGIAATEAHADGSLAPL
eukprot:NODE_216_length_1798_cov_434.676420.p1 GENE.NODE_216_length_1798_cov_434.676420~~NODE_216_length_1798_cov_434.676420.p1  ORF type:complete len:500 (+),score=142.24 NODE_216_length_1798_cov_434.676420:3-1502(+)